MESMPHDLYVEMKGKGKRERPNDDTMPHDLYVEMKGKGKRDRPKELYIDDATTSTAHTLGQSFPRLIAAIEQISIGRKLRSTLVCALQDDIRLAPCNIDLYADHSQRPKRAMTHVQEVLAYAHSRAT